MLIMKFTNLDKLCKKKMNPLMHSIPGYGRQRFIVDFQDIDREIKLQIIHACHSRRLRRKGLKTTGITLTQILDEERALELAENQAKTMESTTKGTSTGSNVDVNMIHPRKTNFYFNKRYKNTCNQKQKQNPQHHQQRLCWYCGGTYPHKPQGTPCPAQGAICRKCGKQNHYARCCPA